MGKCNGKPLLAIMYLASDRLIRLLFLIIFYKMSDSDSDSVSESDRELDCES